MGMNADNLPLRQRFSVAELAMLITLVFTSLTGSAVAIIGAMNTGSKVEEVVAQQDQTNTQVKAVAQHQTRTSAQIEQVHQIVNSSNEALIRKNEALLDRVLQLSKAVATLTEQLRPSEPSQGPRSNGRPPTPWQQIQ